MTIHILPEHITNQIAAGEVVEGPVSVIKELVENSIDSGANQITINTSKNFLCLQVIDNGSGIASHELELAFKKHATSKIKSLDDIYSLSTNGFRGEALPSIASVSKVTCISRTKESEQAYKLYIENNQSNFIATGAGFGTNILIEDLFFNIPVRLKFLKSDTKLRKQIIDTVRAFALSNTDISFNLMIDQKSIVKTSGEKNLRKTFREIFQDESYEKMLEVNFQNEEINVDGLISPTDLYRSDKRGIFTCVNNRILDCYIIRSGVESIYKELLSVGKFPFAFINILMPQSDVDVNVHPNKREVKYASTNKIYNSVANAIAKTLSQSTYSSVKTYQPTLENNLWIHSEQLSLKKPLEENFGFEIIAPKPQITQIANEIRQEKEDTLFNSQRFIARLGSVDIKFLSNDIPKTIIDSQGNKTRFDLVVKHNEHGLLLRGDFIGENWLKEEYLEFLTQIGKKLLERRELEKNFPKNQTPKNQSRPQSKPSTKSLNEIWKRDNYTCVYCGKALLHPLVVKNKLSECDDPALLNSHIASYDHHLPASLFPALNKDTENLYAACQECNKKKSNSLAIKTWKPNQQNAWQNVSATNPLLIGNLKILEPISSLESTEKIT